MVCIVYSLTNLKELKSCEAHLSFLSQMKSLNDLSCTRTCDPSLQRLRSCDFIELESQTQWLYLKIHTHLRSHASEMLLRVILAANYKYLKKKTFISSSYIFFLMNCDLKLNKNEPGTLKDLGYKLRILFYLKQNKRLSCRKTG